MLHQIRDCSCNTGFDVTSGFWLVAPRGGVFSGHSSAGARVVRKKYSPRRHRALLAGVLFLLMSLCTANAAIYVDKDATAGSDNGTSWADAYTNLNTALTKATGEFWIAEGTYITPVSAGIQLNNTNELYGGFQGTESSRSERNWTTYPTILDGGANRVLQKTTAGTAILDGFTVQNGYRSGANGAGIYCTAGSLDIRNCVFTNNNTAGTAYGGAVYHRRG